MQASGDQWTWNFRLFRSLLSSNNHKQNHIVKRNATKRWQDNWAGTTSMKQQNFSDGAILRLTTFVCNMKLCRPSHRLAPTWGYERGYINNHIILYALILCIISTPTQGCSHTNDPSPQKNSQNWRLCLGLPWLGLVVKMSIYRENIFDLQRLFPYCNFNQTCTC